MEKEELLEAMAAALANKQQLALETLAKEAVTNYADEAFGYAYLAESLSLEVPARLPQAEIVLAKAAEIEPDNIDYLIRFAEIKDRQGKFEDAQIIWTKVLSHQPDYAPAMVAMANYQLAFFQDYAEALSLLNQAIEIDASPTEQYLLRAKANNGLGNYEDALADVEKILADGFAPIATLIKIEILKAIGQEEDTFLLYEQLIQHDPSDYTIAFNYGQDLVRANRLEDAVQQFEFAILQQQNPEASHYTLLGETALYAMQLEKAIEAFNKAIELDKSNLEQYILLIEAKTALKDFDGAIKEADNLIAQAKDDQSLLERATVQKAIALIYKNELDAAEELLTPIAKVEGLRQKEGLYGLGMVYQARGKAARAYRFMKAAKMLDHLLAETYIRTNLKDYVAKLQTQILEKNKTEIAKNASSKAIQKMAGKLWKFDTLESEQLQEMPEEFRNRIAASMQDTALLLTDKGVLMVSDTSGETLTYTIKKEGSNAVIVDFVPLDKTPSYPVKLQLSANGLAFNKEKNEVMHFVALDPANASDALISNFKKHIHAEQIAFLGDDAMKVVEQLM